MTLINVRFGDYIKLVKIKCGISNLAPDDVSGINRDKEFFEPSKQVGGDTSSYKVVPPNCFACNIMHVGRDAVLPIALNTTNKNKIVSPAYTVFEWTGDNVLLKEYLFMMLNSSEKDRYFWFHCDSSVRDGMDWNAFCNIELEVPSIEIQKKYVAIYEGMLANLRSYEKGLDDLKLVCDGYIEELRRKNLSEEIGKYLSENKRKNNECDALILGISKDGFIEPKQDVGDQKNYTLFGFDDFVYSPPRINVGSIGLFKKELKCACSPIYVSFHIVNKQKIIPEYLLLWFKREEFKRYTEFYSISSVRNNFSFDLLCHMMLPIPELKVQKSITDVFKIYDKRMEYRDELKQRISSICPILIRGSIDEANGVKR